jgi:hypothetical protein
MDTDHASQCADQETGLGSNVSPEEAQTGNPALLSVKIAPYALKKDNR